MILKHIFDNNSRFTWVTCALAICLSIYALYQPGITGASYYDDTRPLSALSKVKDIDSARSFVFSETSGPLGRPIAMLSFLLNTGDYPNDIAAILKINIFIHTLNTFLVFGFGYLITLLLRNELSDTDKQATYKKALITGSLLSLFWGLSSLNVSATLIPIQRMATLSAFFVFAGLNLYVFGLYRQSQATLLKSNNNSGLLFQIIGIFAFGFLAVFTKENGALLPIYILVLEITLFSRLSSIQKRRSLRLAGGLLVLAIVLIYLLIHFVQNNGQLPGRDYTALERLISQPQILIEYFKLAFIPNIESFNPFHDNTKFVTLDSLSLPSLAGLFLILASLVFSVIYRKKYVTLSFAIMWYLGAHVLESTNLNLELYFEHRNYIAILGPYFFLASLLISLPNKYKLPTVFLSSIYLLYLAFNLYLTTSLWGNKPLAAHQWFQAQPGSSRASEHLAIELFNQNKWQDAAKVMELQIANCPDCTSSVAHAMFFSCLLKQNEKANIYYNKLFVLKEDTLNTRAIPSIFNKLSQAVSNNDCTAFTLKDIKKLNQAFLELPSSPFNKKLLYLQNLYVIAIKERNVTAAIEVLSRAWEEQNDFLIANELTALLLKNKQVEFATEIAEEYCMKLPSHVMLRNKHSNECDLLREKVRKATIYD